MIEARPHQPFFLGSCPYSRGTEWSHGSALCGRLGLGANPGRRCLWRVSLSTFYPPLHLLWFSVSFEYIFIVQELFNTVSHQRTDLCMQIPKLCETEGTQSFVRVNGLFFLLFFGGGGVQNRAKQSIFSLKFRDF